jgi:hypothetical protein
MNKRLVTYLSSGTYWIIGWSVVDQNWNDLKQGYPTNLRSQSLLSRARTDPNWKSESLDRKYSVTGRRYWPSDPIVVTVREDGNITIDNTVFRCNWWQNNNQILNHQIRNVSRYFDYVSPKVNENKHLIEESHSRINPEYSIHKTVNKTPMITLTGTTIGFIIIASFVLMIQIVRKLQTNQRRITAIKPRI